MLTNLKTLSLSSNNVITNNGLSRLVNLKTLDLSSNNTITDDCFQTLTNIKYLDLTDNHSVSNKGISCLRLISLYMDDSDIIMNDSLVKIVL